MEKDENKDVHTEHCCQIHGCKYGGTDCTVVRFEITEKSTSVIYEKPQSHMCLNCEYDLETEWDLIIFMNEVYDRGYDKAWAEANSYMRDTYGA